MAISTISPISTNSETGGNGTPSQTGVPTPVEQTLEDLIIEQLNSYDYPITAQFIGKNLSKTKKEINSMLYRMKTSGTVETLVCAPPLWRML